MQIVDRDALYIRMLHCTMTVPCQPGDHGHKVNRGPGWAAIWL